MAILKRQLEAIDRIIARNGCIRKEEDAKPYLGKFFDSAKRCYVANPFAVVRFNKDVPEINLAVDGKRFNAENFVDEFRDKDNHIFDIPSAKELRKIRYDYRKSVGGMEDMIFTTSQKDAPYLNMNYLIDMLEAMPNGTLAYYSASLNAVYFTNYEDAEGILMPINRNASNSRSYHVHIHEVKEDKEVK